MNTLFFTRSNFGKFVKAESMKNAHWEACATAPEGCTIYIEMRGRISLFKETDCLVDIYRADEIAPEPAISFYGASAATAERAELMAAALQFAAAVVRIMEAEANLPDENQLGNL